MPAAKRRGRPPAGPDGETRASMRQISARLSRASQAQLKALSAVLQVSQAEVITRALDALEQSLGAQEQRLVAMLRKRNGS